MSEATITCYCGSCELGLAEQAATCFFQCGCNSCRQKIQFGQAKGGREFVPLPKLFYMPSVITSMKGKKHLQAFQLRENTDSTQIYCTKCWAILGVDHVNYPDSIFLNFPEFCVNTGDLSVPLSAYIMMSDYNEDVAQNTRTFHYLNLCDISKRQTFRSSSSAKTFSEPDRLWLDTLFVHF